MIEIILTDKIKSKAREWADKISKTRTLTHYSNYTRLNIDDRYYYGYLGEIAFWKVLHDHHSNYKYEPKFDGKSDGCDFIVNGKKVDVKTASKSTYRNIMLPKSQWVSKYRDYYVGVQINGDEAIIHGYCTHSDFKESEFGRGVVTMYNSFDSLKPIGDII